MQLCAFFRDVKKNIFTTMKSNPLKRKRVREWIIITLETTQKKNQSSDIDYETLSNPNIKYIRYKRNRHHLSSSRFEVRF